VSGGAPVNCLHAIFQLLVLEVNTGFLSHQRHNFALEYPGCDLLVKYQGKELVDCPALWGLFGSLVRLGYASILLSILLQIKLFEKTVCSAEQDKQRI
jgi:hypothetical protein